MLRAMNPGDRSPKPIAMAQLTTARGLPVPAVTGDTRNPVAAPHAACAFCQSGAVGAFPMSGAGDGGPADADRGGGTADDFGSGCPDRAGWKDRCKDPPPGQG